MPVVHKLPIRACSSFRKKCAVYWSISALNETNKIEKLTKYVIFETEEKGLSERNKEHTNIDREETRLTTGPLQQTVTMYTKRLAGEQATHWDVLNKANSSSQT